ETSGTSPQRLTAFPFLRAHRRGDLRAFSMSAVSWPCALLTSHPVAECCWKRLGLSKGSAVLTMYTRSAMSNRKFFIPCLLLSLVCAPALFAQKGFVHTSGSEIVDASGKPLMLRGINLGNWFEPEGYMFHFDNGPQSPREIEDLTNELIGPEKSAAFWKKWRETYITEADIDRIKKAGFNSVRVPSHWKFFDSDN